MWVKISRNSFPLSESIVIMMSYSAVRGILGVIFVSILVAELNCDKQLPSS